MRKEENGILRQEYLSVTNSIYFITSASFQHKQANLAQAMTMAMKIEPQHVILPIRVRNLTKSHDILNPDRNAAPITAFINAPIRYQLQTPKDPPENVAENLSTFSSFKSIVIPIMLTSPHNDDGLYEPCLLRKMPLVLLVCVSSNFAVETCESLNRCHAPAPWPPL